MRTSDAGDSISESMPMRSSILFEYFLQGERFAKLEGKEREAGADQKACVAGLGLAAPEWSGKPLTSSSVRPRRHTESFNA
jgi:hypothetical protein